MKNGFIQITIFNNVEQQREKLKRKEKEKGRVIKENIGFVDYILFQFDSKQYNNNELPRSGDWEIFDRIESN